MSSAALSPAGRALRRGRSSASVTPLVLALAGFSVLYLLRDLAGLSLPDIIVTSLYGAAFLFLDVGASLGLYIFSTTLVLPSNEIRIVYILVLCLKLFRSRKLRLHSGILLLTIGILALQLIDMALFSGRGVGSFVYDYVIRMLVFIPPLLWYSTSISARDYRRALMCYAVGALLGATLTLILTAQTQGLVNLLLGNNRFLRLGLTQTDSVVGMRTNYNANQLGIMMTLTMAILLIAMDLKKLPKLVAFSGIGYALFILMLTRSRTSLLLAVFTAAVYYWVVIIRRRQIRRGLVLFIVMLCVVALVVHLFPGIVTATLNRFIGQEDISNGRTELFQFYITEWSANPWCFLFGYGIGSYSDVLTHATNSPHNILTDILICWGVTGVLLLAGVWFLCTRRHARLIPRQKQLLAYLPAIIAFVASLGGQYLTTGFPHLRLCFLILAAKGLADLPEKE